LQGEKNRINSVLMIAKPVFPLVDYAVNYDYITTVLCENKQNRLFNVMENVI
jgi:hypothetical protein